MGEDRRAICWFWRVCRAVLQNGGEREEKASLGHDQQVKDQAGEQRRMRSAVLARPLLCLRLGWGHSRALLKLKYALRVYERSNAARLFPWLSPDVCVQTAAPLRRLWVNARALGTAARHCRIPALIGNMAVKSRTRHINITKCSKRPWLYQICVKTYLCVCVETPSALTFRFSVCFCNGSCVSVEQINIIRLEIKTNLLMSFHTEPLHSNKHENNGINVIKCINYDMSSVSAVKLNSVQCFSSV